MRMSPLNGLRPVGLLALAAAGAVLYGCGTQRTERAYEVPKGQDEAAAEGIDAEVGNLDAAADETELLADPNAEFDETEFEGLETQEAVSAQGAGDC